MLKFFALEPGFKLFFLEANNQQPEKWSTESQHGAIQFHFCLSGEALYAFNNNTYRMALKADHVLLLYHPNHTLPAEVIAHRGTKIFSVFISIKKFHALFTDNTYHIPFLSEELKGKKYYQLQDYNLSVQMVLNQLFNNSVHEDLKHLYLKGKTYEILSLFFDTNDKKELISRCPFLADEKNVLKIKRAKEIMLERMENPPGLQELADEIGLSLKKLNQGFKEIYGTTIYGLLLDHKMEYAKTLLDSGMYNVNEVGLRLGYSTASHFIAAFKKKYGTTPKKYITG